MHPPTPVSSSGPDCPTEPQQLSCPGEGRGQASTPAQWPLQRHGTHPGHPQAPSTLLSSRPTSPHPCCQDTCPGHHHCLPRPLLSPPFGLPACCLPTPRPSSRGSCHMQAGPRSSLPKTYTLYAYVGRGFMCHCPKPERPKCAAVGEWINNGDTSKAMRSSQQ